MDHYIVRVDLVDTDIRSLRELMAELLQSVLRHIPIIRQRMNRTETVCLRIAVLFPALARTYFIIDSAQFFLRIHIHHYLFSSPHLLFLPDYVCQAEYFVPPTNELEATLFDQVGGPWRGRCGVQEYIFSIYFGGTTTWTYNRSLWSYNDMMNGQ